jgi:rhodanese-related sulfurtransferase
VGNSAGSTTYTVTVTRENVTPIPTLSNLQLSVGTLAPAFNASTVQYTVSVANSVTSVTVTPTTTAANASITVNGTNVASGSVSGAINLNVGSNAITIVVGNSVGSTTYTVTITRNSQSSVYRKIAPAEALIMMSQSSGYIILDVRTELEYKEKHIINAVLIPHTEVNARAPAELPNKNQFIYVYCKAGVRSEMAARDLVELGYTNVYDIGGLDDWPYSTWTVSGPPPTYWSDLADIQSWWNNALTNFTISTPEQFAAIANLSIYGITTFSGKTITLTSDIDLAGIDWATVSLFEGVFDGGGHTISNMRIESSGEVIGLFGTLGAGGTIKNLTLKDMEIIICPA